MNITKLKELFTLTAIFGSPPPDDLIISAVYIDLAEEMQKIQNEPLHAQQKPPTNLHGNV